MRPSSPRLALALGLALVASSARAQAPRPYAAARHGGNYMFNYYLPPAPGSTPWAPCWSPDGRWIAVGMSGSIWRVDPATGAAEELTHSGRYHSSPSWSPDGKWIVYTADDDARSVGLEMLNVETGEAHALSHDEWLYADPVFSPQGDRLAYVSTAPSGYFNVYVRGVRDGQWAGEAVAVTRDHGYGENRLYFGEWDMHIEPAWLPDGRELLLVSNRDVPLGSGNALRVPAEEDGILRARTVLAEQTLYRTRPDVSPDGKRFVYSSTRGAADQWSNLYVQPTAGGEPYKLTFFQHDAFHPRWSPDGEWIAYVDNREGLPQLALLETYGGAQRMVAITERRWKQPMGTLKVETVDAASGEPTPSRIHLSASDGRFYAPTDAFARIGGLGGDPLFHHPGRFALELPAGPATLEAVKGFEFVPIQAAVEIRAGEETRLTLRLERIADMGAQGWFSGSTHVHMNYGGGLHNTLENLMAMSAAEDQDVVNEEVANKDNRVLDHQFFVPGGGPHPLSQPDRILMVGQEYRPPFWGHVFLLGLRDHLISPFTTGYSGTAIESLYPSNTDILRKARAQGATTGYVHPFPGDADPLDADLGGGKGYLVDAALGTVDALEWSAPGNGAFFPWYATLNNGLRVTAVGGEDSISNLRRSKLVGAVRTYVHTGDRGLDAGAWFEELRGGHAFVSTGPLVELTADGRMPGEEIALPAEGGTVEVRIRVRSITPLDRAELVVDGRVVEALSFEGDRRRLEHATSLRFEKSGWLHLRVAGRPEERRPLDSEWAQAFTNPVWVTVGGRPPRSLEAAEYGIRWIDRLRELAAAWPGWRSEREREHVFAQFDAARRVYERFADEARAAAPERDPVTEPR